MKNGKNVTRFCEEQGFSRATYYNLRKANLAPKERRFPGKRDVIITAQAEKDWERLMDGAEVQRLAQLQFELRSAQARLAGKRAAQSKPPSVRPRTRDESNLEQPSRLENRRRHRARLQNRW